MDGDIWLILMILLPIIGIVLVVAFQKKFKETKPSRNVNIAVAIIVGALFIAYLIWNYFFR